jgi:excisionase family DNA binding protein
VSATLRRLMAQPERSSEPLLLSVRDAARELGIGRDAAYALVRSGRLRSVRVSGRHLLIPRTELVAFIAREVEGEEP